MSKRRQYSAENLKNALNYMRTAKEPSARKAEKLFGVPRATIGHKLRHPETKDKCGPMPVLSTAEESALAEWLINIAKCGFPRKKEDVLTCVEDFLNKTPRPNPFRNNRPGDAWFKSFLIRKPNVALRTSEGVTNSSACIKEADLRKWFEEIQQYITDENLNDAISDPNRVFNGDETGFNICPRTGKVLAEKGCKNVYEIERAPAKENLTVMFSFSAAGLTLKPMVIYPYKRIPQNIAESVPSGWGIGRSDSGWMTSSVFYEYILNVFYPQLITNNIQLPVILFVDGHKSHITIEVSEICKGLQIHLIALYPNSTRILQPADVAAFRPIKEAWKRGLREWYSKNDYKEILTKVTFAPLLKNISDDAIKPTTLANGFRVCGLFPFDSNNVDYSKCLPSAAEKIIKQVNPIQSNQGEDDVNVTLSYTDFSEIVGPTTLKKCEESHKMELESDYFQIIYNLWLKFTKAQTTLTFETKTSIPDENETCDSIPDKQDLLDEITGELRPADDVPSDTTVDKPSVKTISSVEIIDDEIPSCSKSIVQPHINAEKPVIISNVLLSDYLKNKTLPEPPKRKGKRNIERCPYAMTSDSYMDIMRTKKIKKEQEITDKENRKKMREEKKIMNSEKDKQKGKGKGKKSQKLAEKTEMVRVLTPINFENKKKIDKIKVCDICTSGITKKSLSCGICNKVFHTFCIPSFHKKHIPLDRDDGFVCHLCYKETDSSDSDLYNTILNEDY